jgi:hypothetical protein
MHTESDTTLLCISVCFHSRQPEDTTAHSRVRSKRVMLILYTADASAASADAEEQKAIIVEPARESAED